MEGGVLSVGGVVETVSNVERRVKKWAERIAFGKKKMGRLPLSAQRSIGTKSGVYAFTL